MHCFHVADPLLHTGWQMGSKVTSPFVILNGVKNLQPTKHKKRNRTAKLQHIAPMVRILRYTQDDKTPNPLSF